MFDALDAAPHLVRHRIERGKSQMRVRISDIGFLIETEAKRRGYKVIRNLNGSVSEPGYFLRASARPE